MAERTSYEPGTPNWADLSTSDVEAAKTFYGGLFGWRFSDLPADGAMYSMATVRGNPVVGLYQGDGSTPPHWNNYIAVDSVDDTAARAAELGATQMMEPFEVVQVGRMAVVQDPQGAVICFWQAKGHIGASVVNEPGALTWRELLTSNVEAATAFYGELLGWTFQVMDTGGGHGYTIAQVGDTGVCGLMHIPSEAPPMPPAWIAVFGTEDVDAAAAEASQAGASVVREPTDIGEDMGRFAVIQDPQGAVFEVWNGPWER